MRRIIKDILLIATLLDWCQAASVNHYCNTDLCLNSQLRPRKHVACFDDIEDNILHDSEAFTSNCPKDRRMMYMNNELKERLLDVHNELRNRVALGELEGYAPASKMGRLEWDDELAYLAEFNVKKCYMEHDKCRNTYHYRYAGQNLGQSWTYNETNAQVLENLTRTWFAEYKDAGQDIIDSFHFIPDKQIGHFTLMVTDKTTKIGCAAARFTENLDDFDFDSYLLACNYSFTNIYYHPIYVKGKSGSRCQTGCDSRYRGLCTSRENIHSGF